MSCKPENKYPPHPCPCAEIPGPQGIPGPVGIQGPQGEPGDSMVKAYGQAYTTTDQVLTVSPTAGSSVTFTGIQNVLNASLVTGTKIRVTQSGIYQLNWTVMVTTPLA